MCIFLLKYNSSVSSNPVFINLEFLIKVQVLNFELISALKPYLIK